MCTRVSAAQCDARLHFLLPIQSGDHYQEAGSGHRQQQRYDNSEVDPTIVAVLQYTATPIAYSSSTVARRGDIHGGGHGVVPADALSQLVHVYHTVIRPHHGHRTGSQRRCRPAKLRTTCPRPSYPSWMCFDLALGRSPRTRSTCMPFPPRPIDDVSGTRLAALPLLPFLFPFLTPTPSDPSSPRLR